MYVQYLKDGFWNNTLTTLMFPMNFIRMKRMIENKVLHLTYFMVRGSWGGGKNLYKHA